MPKRPDPYDFVGNVKPIDLSSSRVQILTLSGGGYRGLYTAAVLEHLQNMHSEDMLNSFDVIVGTSIGGILAIGLAIGKSPHELKAFFLDHGKTIFKPKKLKEVRQLAHVLYDSNNLKAAIESALGDQAETQLSSISRPLMVTSISRAGARHVFFQSGGFGQAASNVPLIDAALATSAAPTFFSAHSIDPDHFLDGGLIANAPDLAAITYVSDIFKLPIKNIRVLSIGTAGSSAAAVGTPPGGGFKWVSSGDLVNLTMEAQEGLSIELAKRILPEGHYWRIDRTPAPSMSVIRPMDEASDDATQTLLALAKETAADISNNNSKRKKLREFLSHKRHLAL